MASVRSVQPLHTTSTSFSWNDPPFWERTELMHPAMFFSSL